ncbi:MAG: Ig-like domain-containing protein, partial [Ilumatobacteraceae bacterium]
MKLLVLLGPIAASVVFVAVASRVVHRPRGWLGVAAWWVGLTAASTVVLAATERVMRRFLPLAALFNLSLVFPDHSPSRFKVAMRTNTLRQLQRTIEEGTLDGDDEFQEAAERLVALAGALNAHDRRTRGHTERVRAYTLMIGEEMHLPKADLDRLHWAGLVHDIGKLEVPGEILNKPGRPDDAEWEVLKQHPARGLSLVAPLRGWLGEWADAASQHHERWDGKGYPFGLAGEQITLSGRIVAVADAFDVMTSVRSYKKAMTPEEARAELLRCAGTQFDPEIVRAFLNISVGKLRLVMGPLSWLAQAPALGNVPISSAAATGASALMSVGIAVAGGLTSDPTPPPVPPARVAFVDAPHATPMRLTGLEDEPIELDADALADARQESVSISSTPPHMSVDPSSPATLIPDSDWYGRTVGEYEACWDGDRCSTARVDVTVEPVNDRPIAQPDGASAPEGTGVTIDVLANDTDVDDDELGLVSAGLVSPAGAGVVTMTSDQQVSFEPAPEFAGTARLTYEVADRNGASATGTVTVDVVAVDSPPNATDDDVTLFAGTTETFDVLANDSDREDESLTIVAVKPPSVGEVVLTANSVTYHAPPDTDGQTAFAYVVEDSNGGRGEATVHVTILSSRPADLPPAAPPPPAGPIARDDQATVQEDSGELDLDLVANDGTAGEDLSRHTIALTNAAQLGSAQLVGHELRYRPNADANGTDSLTYALCDTRGRCDAATVTVTILAANDPPQFVAAGALSTTEDHGLTAVAGWASAISPGAANESGQNVGFTVVVDRPSLFASLPAVGSDGTLTFTPAPDAYGTSTITVTARDDGGTANGGADTSSPRLAVITVTPVNDAPQFTDGGAVVTGEDNGPTLVNGWATSITPGPADESAQATSFTTTTDQPALFATAPSVDASGVLSFTPAPNAHGSASITVTAIDDGGTSDGGVDTSAAHTSTITVTPVNDPVVAAGDSATVAEDTIAGVT